MEAILKQIAEIVALACETAAVLVVAIGAARAMLRLVLGGYRLPSLDLKKEVWVRFAAWILLSLEFALAADIVRTAIAPTWEDIGKLAAIATIRTALNYFLERDLEGARANEGGGGGGGKEKTGAAR